MTEIHPGPPRKYPFDNMEIGDYFEVLFDREDVKDLRRKQSQVLSCARHRQASGTLSDEWKFKTQTDVMTGELRCWRIK